MFLSTWSLRTKLMSLLAGALALALVIAGVGILSLRMNHAALETVYRDRVVPLQQLKSISDDYAVLVIDAVNKANAGVMEGPEALESIRIARARIRKNWRAYEATYQTPEERVMSERAKQRFGEAEPVLDDLERRLAAGGRDLRGRLGDFDGPLYATIDPLGVEIQGLVELQLRVAREEYETGVRTYKSVLLGMVGLMGAGAVVLLLAGGGLARSIYGRLDGAVRELRAGAGQLAATADHLSQANQLIAQGASEQSRELEEIGRTQGEVAEHSRENASRAQASLASMEGVLGAFRDLAENAEGVTRMMSDIEASGKKMKAIMGMVEEIAFQTNILSLNASVEAARAGEHGRGFSVVADEVRALALRSAEAAKKTSAIIEESARRIEEGTRLVAVMGEQMERSSRLVEDTQSEVGSIAEASTRQRESVVAVAKSIRQLEGVAQSNAAATEEGASASEELQAQFHSVLGVVERLETLLGGAGGPAGLKRARLSAPRAGGGGAIPWIRSAGAGFVFWGDGGAHGGLPAFFFELEEFGAAAGFDGLVEAGPEFEEVISGGDEGEEHGAPEGGVGPGEERGGIACGHDEGDSEDLDGGFGFAEVGGGDGIAFGGGDGAEAGDGEFAADDEDGHPGGDAVDLNGGDEGGGDEEFVGDGVEEHADGGDLVPAAGEVAIEEVGEGGDEEDEEGEEVVGDGEGTDLEADVFGDERGDEQRDEEDAEQG